MMLSFQLKKNLGKTSSNRHSSMNGTIGRRHLKSNSSKQREFEITHSNWLKGKSKGNGFEFEIKGNSHSHEKACSAQSLLQELPAGIIEKSSHA